VAVGIVGVGVIGIVAVGVPVSVDETTATGNVVGVSVNVGVGGSDVKVGVATIGTSVGMRVFVTVGEGVPVAVMVKARVGWAASDLKAIPLHNDSATAAIPIPPTVSQIGLRMIFNNFALNELFRGANPVMVGRVKTIVLLFNDPTVGSR
jgi:hypothetical protein